MEVLRSVFPVLVERALTTAVLILAVMILRLALRRAPRWSVCLLWAVVAAAMVLPRWIPSPVSAYQGTEELISVSTVQREPGAHGRAPVLRVEMPAMAANVTVTSEEEEVGEAAEEVPAETHGIQVPLEAAAVVWLAGLLCITAYGAASYIGLRRRVRVSVPDGEAYICDGIDTPFVLGVFRPKIYLPAGVSPRERDFVIAHEKAHIRRLDQVWKPLGFAILAVYWFAPLCWAAYILFCRDMEAACDESVIGGMDLEKRQEYSRTLLALCGGRKISVCPLAFGETGIRARIKAVLSYRKPAFWITAAAIAACCVIAVCFLTAPEDMAGDDAIDPGESAVETGLTEGEHEIQRPEIPAETVEFYPGDAHDLVRAEVHEWFGDFTVTDEDSLAWLEDMVNGAVYSGDGAIPNCPYGVKVYLYRADGTVGTVEPATDSCDTIKSGDRYYEANSGWNRGVWDAFGIEPSFKNQELDSDGNVIRETEYYWYMPAGITEYQYDVSGNMTAQQYLASAGDTAMWRKEYEYDGSGNKLRDDYYSSGDDGKLEFVSYTLYEYDEAGNMVRSRNYYPDGGVRRIDEFEYDDQGRLIRFLEEDGSWTEYRYDDNGFVGEYIYSSDGTPGSYYERWYDENGNVLRQYIYEPDGTLNNYTFFTYNDTGELIGKSDYNGQGELISSW